MTKKRLLIVGICLSLGFIGVLLWKLGTPPPTSQTPRQINPEGDTILFENEKYQIVFLPRYKNYTISITGSPFDVIRKEAEENFLSLLKISSAQACQFSVSVSTPFFANQNESGQTFPLSFCASTTPSATPGPDLSLNSNLAALTVKGVSPQQGIASYGNTNNAIRVEFDQPVDPKFAVVRIDPKLSIYTAVRTDFINRLLIIPSTDWQKDASYTITLLAGLRSQDGKFQLKEDVVMRFTMNEPQYQLNF